MFLTLKGDKIYSNKTLFYVENKGYPVIQSKIY